MKVNETTNKTSQNKKNNQTLDQDLEKPLLNNPFLHSGFSSENPLIKPNQNPQNPLLPIQAKSSNPFVIQKLDSEDETEEATLPEDITTLLDEIAPPPPDVPTFEAIGVDVGFNSAGELTERITRLWQRQRLSVGEAARRVAEEDERITSSEEDSERPNYDFQWAIYFGAADYTVSWGDLSDVAEHLRRGSPFRSALEGSYDRVINVANPTGAEIEARIRETLAEMNLHALEIGGIGELLVYYEGHGGAGGGASVVMKRRPQRAPLFSLPGAARVPCPIEGLASHKSMRGR